MTELIKNGVVVSFPQMDQTAKLNMERCAEFLARMIQKYGGEVLASIKAKEAECAGHKESD